MKAPRTFGLPEASILAIVAIAIAVIAAITNS
jgi:hypothetical protein